jgi:hypothetical protein
MTDWTVISQNLLRQPGVTRREFVREAMAIGLGLGLFPLDSAASSAAVIDPTLPGAGKAHAQTGAGAFSLSNEVVQATWEVFDNRFKGVMFNDRLTGKTIRISEESFSVALPDGKKLAPSMMRVVRGPVIEKLKADKRAARFSERLGGQQILFELDGLEGGIHIVWRGILRDGSNYIRQEWFLEAKGGDVPILEITLLDMKVDGAEVSGRVKGSPVVAGNLFFGFEHPLSMSTVSEGRIRCSLSRELPLKAGQNMTCSSVMGVTSPGQLRRGFLNYTERERAHPYRTFLHYNSWYDLGYFTKYDEAGALNVIEAFGTELFKKRGVVLNSFLFDDGWDDPATLWKFHAGFPRGFAPLKVAAARYNAAPGVWLSPWGGYGKPKQERLKFGQQAGFESNAGGFALSGPKYYRLFRDICMDMIRNYGVNHFKFDGTGNASSVIQGSEFGSDFEAAIHLIKEVRAQKPDLFVNLTTGTYPSPFWLQYADSIWRGGEDHSFAGVGTNRQQWITYRDADTHSQVVKGGPLFPLNSLMLHGLIYARHAKNLDVDPQGDFCDEIRSYFGSGTQLQEMYVTPALLSARNWDTLAEAANWSRRNMDVLVDTHWIGGDPGHLEVYGWASWSRKRGILVLRNPSDKYQSLELDVQHAFELPAGAAQKYLAHSPWRQDPDQSPCELTAGRKHTFELKPFQVLTLEAEPRKGS